MENIVDKLTAAGPSIACPWDSSVHNSFKHLLGSKYLLAANFKDNQNKLPKGLPLLHTSSVVYRLIPLNLELAALQNDMLSMLQSYRDLYLSRTPSETHQSLREVISLHVLNHITKYVTNNHSV